MNFNRVLIAGNLTRDIEVKYTQTGTAVANFSIAINRSWTKDGETKKEVTFVDVIAWGKTAEFIGKYFSKGRPIFVEGRLQKREWEDKEGKKQYKTEVIAEKVEFVGKKEETKSNASSDANETTTQNNDDEAPF